ncbi:hypothetical protein BDZ97DRAFT_1404316 [Flammula alnicola]|nr:hypothetical protein BDZ97DRAFT_1404316 [Flammula alnicola]
MVIVIILAVVMLLLLAAVVARDEDDAGAGGGSGSAEDPDLKKAGCTRDLGSFSLSPPPARSARSALALAASFESDMPRSPRFLFLHAQRPQLPPPSSS